MTKLPVTINYRKEGKKLIPMTDIDIIRENTFISSLKDGEKVEVTYQVQVDDHSYAQLGKLHACIRELAKDTGVSFIDMKKEVKMRMKYIMPDGDLRSFGDASKEELSQAIQMCLEIGDIVNVNLHTH